MAASPKAPSTSHDRQPVSGSMARSRSAAALQSPLAEDEIDPATRALYTPHTVTGLLIGIAILIYSSRAFNPPGPKLTAQDDPDHTIRHGLVAAVFVWLGYAFLQGPATCMIRPHPAVWRVIHGVIVVYLLICVFLLFQNVHDARKFLQLLYPDLGVDMPERAYGSDCRLFIPGQGINWPVINSTLFDEFVIAHTLGWWGKAVILRNYPMLWLLSVGFEFMELTFQHMLPNFNECWWDSWLLDVALCNFIGLLAGMWTVRYFGSLEYDWRGISQQPTMVAKARRGLAQLGPREVDRFEWRAFSSPLRCLQCLGPLAVILLCEVNAFFLKYILWVPPLNPLNTYRLVLLFALAVPAVREWYMFIETEQVDVFNKLGPFAWLGIALSFVETLVVIKFGRGMFPNQWPRNTLLAWGTAGGLFALVMSVWSVQHYLLRPKRRPAQKAE